MGSRSRSIRLRIYFLVAIPLIAMVGLLAYVTGTLVNNAVNLDRAPNLINATSVPAAQFVNFLQSLTQAVAKVDTASLLVSLLASDPKRNEDFGRELLAAVGVARGSTRLKVREPQAPPQP